MWRGLIGVVLMAVVARDSTILHAQGESSRVRPESDAIRALIDRGMEGSATFRDLNNRLEHTNVIVYVRFSSCSPRVPSCLLWASSIADTRRLLIKIDRFGRSPDELTAFLAHELQHASEVADDAGIIDIASFQRSFAARGHEHAAGFETEEAAQVSRRVAAELTRGK